MRWHTLDYRTRDGGSDEPGCWVNRGFWLWLPRPLVLCRLMGHRPVVDGTEGFNGQPGRRWVCCGRCGLRPTPQGDLPAQFAIGDRYDGPWCPGPGHECPGSIPGPWPDAAEGVIGGQVVAGRNHLFGAGVKVGHAGSEHVLTCHAGLPFLGAVYLHTEQFGTWVQRRLVPSGYESRVIEVHVYDRHLSWELWTLRDSGRQAGWRSGYVKIDPRDIVWGEKRYSYTGTAEATAGLTLPGGDTHAVTLTLQRCSYGRPGRRQVLSWTVRCSVDRGDGISHRDGGWKDGLTGWAVRVSDDAVAQGLWPEEALAASMVKITGMRVRSGWTRETLRRRLAKRL